MSLAVASFTILVLQLVSMLTLLVQVSNSDRESGCPRAARGQVWLARGLQGLLLGALCLLTGCQQPAAVDLATPDPVPVDGIGYLVFSAPIAPASRDMFMADVTKLRNLGAREIHIGMNSPGGEIDSAQAMVDYMARTHAQDGVTFKAYNLGVVASAATYVFLNAQDRYSVARGAFLFHAAGLVSNGPLNAQALRDQADKLDAYERVVRATMRTRTKLTEAEARTYVRRTVMLNSDDAQRDGVVDGIAAFVVPKGARSWFIVAKPANPATLAKPATAAFNPSP